MKKGKRKEKEEREGGRQERKYREPESTLEGASFRPKW